MKTDETLDLRSVAVPYCFLLCKSALSSMKPGTILEIQLLDPEILRDLLTILDRSGEKVVAEVRSAEGSRLWVQKGSTARPILSTQPERLNNG